jgi:hypothetical protein
MGKMADMDRGVIVGGSLIAASFLVAVLLNRSAHEEAAPVEAPRKPPAHVCQDSEQRPTTPGVTIDPADADCVRPPVEPLRP